MKSNNLKTKIILTNTEPATSGKPKTPESSLSNPTLLSGTRQRRRQFPGEYKLRILLKTDAMKSARQRREFLKQENLFPSTLNRWRKKRTQCLAQGIPSKKRGRKKTLPDSRLAKQALTLEKKIQRLKNRISQARATIREMKKRIHARLQTEVVDKTTH